MFLNILNYIFIIKYKRTTTNLTLLTREIIWNYINKWLVL